MKNEKLDLQVGDRITYKIIKTNEISTLIIDGDSFLDDLKDKNNIELIKIERPHYGVIEEKKELLTEEEKATLKDIIKNVNKYSCIKVDKISLRGTNNGKLVINCFNNDCCIFEMVIANEFRNLKKSEKYTLKELGLEEE